MLFCETTVGPIENFGMSAIAATAIAALIWLVKHTQTVTLPNMQREYAESLKAQRCDLTTALERIEARCTAAQERGLVVMERNAEAFNASANASRDMQNTMIAIRGDLKASHAAVMQCLEHPQRMAGGPPGGPSG